MPIDVSGGMYRVVRLSLPPAEFPGLLERHVLAYPTTSMMEALGRDYVTAGFPEVATSHFVRRVCEWGNRVGVWGQVRKRNKWNAVRDQLKSAHKALVSDDAKAAIKGIEGVEGLAVSFGSKHLRFLDPERAVVLDSIISESLGYPRTTDGYVEFLSDCVTLRDLLNNAGIAASPTQRHWRVCDVEMAIYMKLRK